jgi:hypothetical protein
MWFYAIPSGRLSYDGTNVATGYSGFGAGRNNLDMVNVPDVGPIPPGVYTIGAPYDDPHLGPHVMHLDAETGTNTYGRSLFRIHGNNVTNDASHGCVILDRFTRQQISSSKDNTLTVTIGD